MPNQALQASVGRSRRANTRAGHFARTARRYLASRRLSSSRIPLLLGILCVFCFVFYGTLTGNRFVEAEEALLLGVRHPNHSRSTEDAQPQRRGGGLAEGASRAMCSRSTFTGAVPE
jgi:hypothetical protein